MYVVSSMFTCFYWCKATGLSNVATDPLNCSSLFCFHSYQLWFSSSCFTEHFRQLDPLMPGPTQWQCILKVNGLAVEKDQGNNKPRYLPSSALINVWSCVKYSFRMSHSQTLSCPVLPLCHLKALMNIHLFFCPVTFLSSAGFLFLFCCSMFQTALSIQWACILHLEFWCVYYSSQLLTKPKSICGTFTCFFSYISILLCI